MANHILENASDLELRCILRENGFPNWPITETTRNMIIMKLKKHICHKDQKKNELEKLISSNNGLFIENQYSNRLKNKELNITSKKCLPIGTAKASREYFTRNRESTTDFKNTMPLKQIQRTANMFVAPPVLESDSGEDSDYPCYVRKNVSHKSAIPPVNNSGNIKHFGVVTRLLNLRDKTLISTRNKLTYESENSSKHKLKSQFPPVITGRLKREHSIFKSISFVQNTLRRLNVTTGCKQQIFVPYALIGLFLTFLVMLACMYMVMRPDLPNSIHENSTQFVLCSDESSHEGPKKEFDFNTSARECIERSNLADIITLSKDLIVLLQETTNQQYCSSNSSGQPISVSVNVFIQYQVQKNGFVIGIRKLMERIEDVKYLIQHNPQWGVGVLDAEKSMTISSNSHEVPYQNLQFVLHKPSLPVICALYTKIQRFFVLIGTAAVLAAIFLLTFIALRYVHGWRNDRLIAIDHFTKDILDELLYRASLVGREATDETDHVVIINHLRDKLLPLKGRNALLWSWNQALQLLETNDSRVQFGACMRNGEEFRTMQWIGNTLDQASGYNKQWQSQAFDNLNKIANPPTPCLKIRHMFDTSEINNPNLKQNIKEAILSKVGTCCNISDIQIDKQSCCVYVRCASEKDAGVVHNEINGWWFDKRLISIKFLRLQRYLYHFPKSSNSHMPHLIDKILK